MDNQQFQTLFSEMLRNYPQALSDRRKLIGLMHDLFPEEQMRVNLAILAFDLGIKEDIDKESYIDESILTRYSMRMVHGHGISTDNAKWCATLWCISYGRDCLCKPLQFNMPEEKMGAYPNALGGEHRREEVPQAEALEGA